MGIQADSECAPGPGRKRKFLSIKEILDKVREIREQAAAVKEKKLDFTALEKSLEKLETDLKAAAEKLPRLAYELEGAPGEIKVAKRIDEVKPGRELALAKKIAEGEGQGKVDVWITERDEPKNVTKVIIRDDRTIQIVLTGIEGDQARKSGDAENAAVARLKKELPEGYTVMDSRYDRGAGTMTFKIASPEGKKTDEGLIRNLVEILKEEIRKK
jgi:hypothetical protein